MAVDGKWIPHEIQSKPKVGLSIAHKCETCLFLVILLLNVHTDFKINLIDITDTQFIAEIIET